MAIDETIDEVPTDDISELDEELDELDPETLSDDDADDDDTADEDDDEAEVEEEALDELEAEELEMLTEDETSEILVVDEAAEMRAIRRAELAMDQQGVAEATEGEFVCSKCFLVLKTSQLANPRKKICRDCAG
jgi:erythromycin esterase-like protein